MYGQGYNIDDENGPGIIPRIFQKLFTTIKSREDEGWAYSIEGRAFEVYNDFIRDLGDVTNGIKAKTVEAITKLHTGKYNFLYVRKEILNPVNDSYSKAKRSRGD